MASVGLVRCFRPRNGYRSSNLLSFSNIAFKHGNVKAIPAKQVILLTAHHSPGLGEGFRLQCPWEGGPNSPRHDMSLHNPPKVSVVVPVHCSTDDHRLFLREALESVASQSLRDMELVIVDDMSPTDIRPIVQSVSGLPEANIIRNEANLGHARSRNVGVQEAKAELIAFLDHDDLWRPEKLDRQVEVLDAEPDAAMTFCDVEVLGDYPAGLYIDQSTVPIRPNLSWLVTHNNCVITVSSVMLRKQALMGIGFFDSRYSSCDDFDAWIKLRMAAPIVRIPEKLATYRLHSHNVNYLVDRRTDNALLTDLLLRVWRQMPPAGKVAMLPTLTRKLAGRAYYRLKSRRA